MSQAYKVELCCACKPDDKEKVEKILRDNIEDDNGSYNYETSDRPGLQFQVNVWGETSIGGDGCEGYHQEVIEALETAGLTVRLESKYMWMEREWDEVIGDLDEEEEES